MATLEERARQFSALETSDNRFQRGARLLQSLWRASKGYPMGQRVHDGETIAMGSRLERDFALRTQANLLTPETRAVVDQVLRARTDQLIDEDRLYVNLLSSQPLCFNLFAPLQRDLTLASTVLAEMTGIAGLCVSAIEFEYSPGRSCPRFSGDRSAFDVCAWCTTPRHQKLLLAIETKYHEDMTCNPRADHTLHQKRSRDAGCFDEAKFPLLERSPIEQIWRDHVLAIAMRQEGECDGLLSVLLFPRQNTHCERAVSLYRGCLKDSSTFAGWYLDQVHALVQKHCQAEWVQEFHDRYLDFAKVGLS